MAHGASIFCWFNGSTLQGGPANDGFLWLTSLHDWLTIEPLGLWEINRTGEWGEHKPTNPMDPNTF